MRVLVCGGRNFTNRQVAFEVLDQFHETYGIDVIIQGGAKGADRRAEEWAKKCGIPFEEYRADWDNITHEDARIKYHPDGNAYDANAGHRRNKKMLDEGKPDAVIAFPGSFGTQDMITQVKATDLPLYLITVSMNGWQVVE